LEQIHFQLVNNKQQIDKQPQHQQLEDLYEII